MNVADKERIMIALISPTLYILHSRKSNWSAEHEKAISTTYPFDLQPSGPDDYVARTYLQFLWLPNSLMPLTYLVPSLRRVEAPSASSSKSPHPMHALLEPLLLSTRSVSNKYHSELLQILANGGGAGEMEEAMMWYSVEHEKPDDIDGSSPQKRGQDGEGQWTDVKWREQYLERMERREVQIQILLYLFKLSLPDDRSSPSSGLDDSLKASRPGKRKRTSKPVVTEPILTLEDHLETFMDKLAMWQLVGRIEDASDHGSAPKTKAKDSKAERDWTQIFVEDVVEPHFKAQLPKLCKLLRTKVFPTSPFSDTESDTTPTRHASPVPTVHSPTTTHVRSGLPLKTALSRTSSSLFARAPSLGRSFPSPTHSTTTSVPSRNLMRSRSSSLSISLAQEQEERAAAAAAAAEQQNRKRGRLHREVSMTRVFKNKGKGKGLGGPGGETRSASGNATVKVEAPKPEKIREDKGVTLVDGTPIKPRTLSTLEKTKNAPIQPLNLAFATNQKGDNDPVAPMLAEGEQEQEEEWMMDSSPAIVVFDPLLEKQKATRTASTVVKVCAGSEEEKRGKVDQRTRSKPSRGKSRKK